MERHAPTRLGDPIPGRGQTPFLVIPGRTLPCPMGRCERVFRLPLCETDDAKLARMKQTLAELGLV